ncbi:hypothetical protein KSP39_PZI013236 [Platanthera zijinensis]|uniref:ATP-dependent DNA helicase n=1 Tax=Platanthera zijinensis TaxID=2320716 RepID=A0AAP0BCX8_9ASPA
MLSPANSRGSRHLISATPFAYVQLRTSLLSFLQPAGSPASSSDFIPLLKLCVTSCSELICYLITYVNFTLLPSTICFQSSQLSPVRTTYSENTNIAYITTTAASVSVGPERMTSRMEVDNNVDSHIPAPRPSVPDNHPVQHLRAECLPMVDEQRDFQQLYSYSDASVRNMHTAEANRAAQRASNRERSQRRRSLMSTEQRDAQRAYNRSYQRARRARMTEAQQPHERGMTRSTARTPRYQLPRGTSTLPRQDFMVYSNAASLPEITTPTPASQSNAEHVSMSSDTGVVHRYSLTPIPGFSVFEAGREPEFGQPSTVHLLPAPHRDCSLSRLAPQSPTHSTEITASPTSLLRSVPSTSTTNRDHYAGHSLRECILHQLHVQDYFSRTAPPAHMCVACSDVSACFPVKLINADAAVSCTYSIPSTTYSSLLPTDRRHQLGETLTMQTFTGTLRDCNLSTLSARSADRLTAAPLWVPSAPSTSTANTDQYAHHLLHANSLRHMHQQAPLNSQHDDTNDISVDVTAPVRPRRHRNHNAARICSTPQQIVHVQLHRPHFCTSCNAKLFDGETPTMCCGNGRIQIPSIPAPPELYNLFISNSVESRHFRRYIRSYNHVFSFTSMGVTLDESLAADQHAVYTFRAHGSIYHRIGSLLPAPNSRPRYLQLYIYDTEHELDYRLQESAELDRALLQKIKVILDTHNPFVWMFRQISQHEDIHRCKLIIKEQHSFGQQYTLPSASQVAAIVVGSEEYLESNERHIIVETIEGHLVNIEEYSGYYDPLQYLLLLPYDTYGWLAEYKGLNNQHVSCCDYYSYILQVRSNIGQRFILPSSFVGSPRDMYQRYQDAMAVVQHYGRPDIFLTMTCNTSWQEITDALYAGQTPQDRPDIVSRIFHAKYEKLKKDIFKKHVLGKTVSHVHVIEFQKRGLPHVHMLVIFDSRDKVNTPDDYDKIVRAELPHVEHEPELYSAVVRHMIHGPCAPVNSHAPCMKYGVCKKDYPKNFAGSTLQGVDSYPLYRRPNNGRSFILHRAEDFTIDNRWVVPYNPWLLLKYDCHINVEVCSSIKSIKYLYKYIHKGPDAIAFQVQPSSEHNELAQYIHGRWICPQEAFWKIFKFSMYQTYPSVVRLQIHLPNKHQVHFRTTDVIDNLLANERNSRTMLTEFFRVYDTEEEHHNYLYTEFPKHYTWNLTSRTWMLRRRRQKVIARMYSVHPSEGERFYLRILLNHIRGPSSFEHLLTVDNITYSTFKEAAEHYGLLERDNDLHNCMREAREFQLPQALRNLLTTILLYCNPTDVRQLWNDNYNAMTEDYVSTNLISDVYVLNRLLLEIDYTLQQHSKSITDFDIPQMSSLFRSMNNVSTLIEDEMSIPISDTDLNCVSMLNHAQCYAFRAIMEAIRGRAGGIFFIDGPGGSGKTFLYRVLLAHLRRDGHIVLATASSGIAATLLPGGTTAHLRFKIPIPVEAGSFCKFGKLSEMHKLIQHCSAILWDEAPMSHKHVFEAVDRSFRDVLNVPQPFGGKVVIMGGDFRQVPPVVVNATKCQIINASIVVSPMWSAVQLLSLSENMRALADEHFAKFLLRIGNGDELAYDDDMIQLPTSMIIPWEGEHSINVLINTVFSDITCSATDSDYWEDRALLATLNDDVTLLNDKCLNLLLGDEITYYSFDSVDDDSSNLYPQEFLNSISPGTLPAHKLSLKKGSPIMLLRNLNPHIGLCNGSRLLCRHFSRNIIEAEILTGQQKGKSVFLPRIPQKHAGDFNMPFELTRKQFPVRLSFAITINKSQGQTIRQVGLYLPSPVFMHGQLYVALSRGVTARNTKVLVRDGFIPGHSGTYTRNVVFKELLSKVTVQAPAYRERFHHGSEDLSILPTGALLLSLQGLKSRPSYFLKKLCRLKGNLVDIIKDCVDTKVTYVDTDRQIGLDTF